MPRLTKWTGLIIVANIAIYFWSAQFPEQAEAFVFRPAVFLVRPWTAITYMFLHAGFSHILFNMLVLYFFGPQVEDRLGGGRFLTLYFVSGLFGAATSMLFSPFAGIVGASAAVFGVELAFAYLWPRAQLLIWGIVPVEARTLIIIMTIISVMGGVGLGMRNVAHFAHLGGFLGGWLVLRVFGVRRFEDKLRPREMRAESASTRPRPGAAERWKQIPLDRLHPVNREEAERVLAKLDARGPTGLTPEEQAFLDRFTAM
jgi:membrane associated rhomboid family serine protease